ncbi:MAG: hypothetical protein A2287_04445 [Candidatus Melainabacteria bacterium RIFOXYA12_FULL_32_12]|nr:MAG: hypothetical protein A2255_03790 [Candidatus Melainabacteria bacterium RIFOXYA2_FULL_32_9]OGI31723.1 MAG: hypothetical protein A2287_04445 [Candidatus Melainabacteria bacterium RIFOXYA12_FULL_32_12]
MKKIIVLFIILAASGVVSAKCFAQSAWNQAQDTDYYGNNAAHSSSDEGARSTAGCGFDTNCGSSTVVDLRDAGEHPTPQLLRNSDGSNPYTPKKYRSLKTTPPPMPR